MKSPTSLLLLALLAGCSTSSTPTSSVTTAKAPTVNYRSKVSPNGRNEIRLYADPLAYEIRRDGEIVVAKSPISLTLSSKTIASPDAVELVAQDDGVAYRFSALSSLSATEIRDERVSLVLPDAATPTYWGATKAWGCEETIPNVTSFDAIQLTPNEKIYLPFVFHTPRAWVAMTEVDVQDYPVLYFTKDDAGALVSTFAKYPKTVHKAGGWDTKKPVPSNARWVVVDEREDYLVKAEFPRMFPWRAFILADEPSKFVESTLTKDLMSAYPKGNFPWIKPGKVAWDWWNAFDNQGDPDGCTTKTYKRFIDFAAEHRIEYVIFDEGWSENLNIWKFSPKVDVPYLIDYANKKGVGIILWMAWGQIVGNEEKVASHFAKLGAKGFKVDFMDRGDAEIANFLERFAAACQKEKMVIDYHGAYRPTGLSERYPNILNYEGIHGLEQLKWFKGGAEEEEKLMRSDVMACYLRMTAGPLDYTPGAMLNHAIGAGYRGTDKKHPGSVGTRCRQMAMMAVYEAPLQMLADSPTNYERNLECFKFMAATPVVWRRSVGLGGTPETYFAVARQAMDGSWYAAGLANIDARDIILPTDFLGEGTWKAEAFYDGPLADREGTSYLHTFSTLTAGEKLPIHFAPGGGFIIHFTR